MKPKLLILALCACPAAELSADSSTRSTPAAVDTATMQHIYAEEKRNGMSGDPQLVKIGDVWVMFYFGAGWEPKALDTFACSRDMVNWEVPRLIEQSEPWDKTYAHKLWVMKHEGVEYHSYCAVGAEGRVIGLATSKDLHTEKTKK